MKKIVKALKSFTFLTLFRPSTSIELTNREPKKINQNDPLPLHLMHLRSDSRPYENSRKKADSRRTKRPLEKFVQALAPRCEKKNILPPDTKAKHGRVHSPGP